MRFGRLDINFLICVLLFFCIGVTGFTGYLQVRLDLHRFVFHKYFAYASLIFTCLHMLINWKKIKAFIRRFSGSRRRGVDN
jgi:hypothetical protein